MKGTQIKINNLVCAAAALLTSTSVLTADMKTWTGDSNGSWTTAGNWFPSALAGGDGVIYNASSLNNLGQALGQDWSITNLTVADVSGPVTIAPGNVLTLSHSPAKAKLDMSAATADLSIYADLSHNNDAPSVYVAAERTLTLSNVLTTVKGVFGPGTVRVVGNAKGFWTLNQGLTMIVDGATLTNNPPLSLAAPAGSTVLAIVTNGAHVHMNQNNTKFPLGTGSSAGVNILRVESGTVTIGKSSSTMGGNALQVGAVADSTGILDINGGRVAVLHKNDNYVHENYLQVTGNGTATGTVNLNGGILVVPVVTSAGGLATLNFNGGVMAPNASTNDWIQGLTHLYVESGGAIFDTAGFNVNINAALEAGSGNGGLTKLGAGTLSLSGPNSYTGSTIVGAGQLTVIGTLAGNADCTVSNNATLALGMSGLGYGPSLSANNLTLGNVGSVNLVFDYGTLYGNPSAAAITAAGTLGVDASEIVLTIQGTGLAVGPAFPLIDYTGTPLANLDNFSLVLPPGVLGRLVNNEANTSIDLEITTAVPVNSLTWYGSWNSDWDLTSPNWNFGNATYREQQGMGDIVTFDDTAINNAVNIATTINPFSMTVDSTVAYTFSGPGKLSGDMTLTKLKNGSLTLSTSNDYSGGTVISAGAVQLGSDSALGIGTIAWNGGVISSDTTAARLLPNDVVLGNQQLIIGNTDNNGTITVDGMLDINSPNVWRSLTLQSDLVLTGGSTNGSLQKQGPATLILSDCTNHWGTQNALIFAGTVAMTNAYLSTLSSLRPECNAEEGISRLIVGPGSIWDNTLGIGNVRTSGGNPSGKASATNIWDILGTVQCSNPTNVYGDLQFDKDRNCIVNLYAGGLVWVRSVQTLTGTLNTGYHELNLDGGTFSATVNSADRALIDGLSQCYVRSGGARIDTAGVNVSVPQALVDGGGAGGLTKLGAGVLTLLAQNTYTGPTVVSDGTLLVNQNHAGTGSVTVAPGAKLGFQSDVAGGVANISAATVNGSLCVAFVNQTGLPAEAAGYVGALTLGGTVALDILSLPDGLVGGETIPLIRYDSLGGNVVLGQLPAGISGSLLNDTASKTIKLVTAPATPPQIGGFAVANGSFELSGSGGPTGGGYSYYVLSATDAAAPIGSWERVSTNSFNNDGTFNATLPVAPGEPQRFYRLQLP